MDVVTSTTQHLVKGEDLNHHGTLYAGRCAEWFVEAGFIAAAQLVAPDHIVCLKIHGLTFTSPVRKGQIATFCSKIVLTGRSRLVAYIEIKSQDSLVVRGFITFIHVDEQGNTLPHGVVVEPVADIDIALHEEARQLPI